MRILPVVALCAFAATVHADKKSDAMIHALDASFGAYSDPSKPSTPKFPRVALIDSETKLNPTEHVVDGLMASWDPYDPVFAYSADGSAGWMAAGLGDPVICGMGDCAKVRRDAVRDMKRKPPHHVTALVDGDQPIFVHLGTTGKGVGAGAMTEQIDADAKDVAQLFESTLADPKVFAASVSSRKDTMMFGTEANERFVGGETVRATLAKWKLSMKKVGGIRAGTTKSKTIAWVIADVEVQGKTATPYRVSAIYEKTGGAWKIVQLHFS